MLLPITLVLCVTFTFGFKLTAYTPWILPSKLDSASLLAFRDISLDFYKVMGSPPVVIRASSLNTVNITGNSVVFSNLANDLLPVYGRERHVLQLLNNGKPDEILVCSGADLRGSIYAMYAFSRIVLGVEPLHYFTDQVIEFRGPYLYIDEINFDSGVPTFVYRGMFTNDEDLLGAFNPDPLGKSVFSADTWDKILEALLRLGGNLIIPGTASFPDEMCWQMANARGVIAEAQHFTVLGTMTWSWPEGIPYSYHLTPEIQKYVWDANIAANEGRDIIWTVGYRGRNDYAFWVDEPEFNTSKARGEVITAAVKAQVDAVHDSESRDADVTATYLWDEMVQLMLSGDFIVPDGTIKVYTDSFPGCSGCGIVEPSIAELVGPGDGLYYHVMMENFHMNQLTEGLPPSTFFTQVRHFVNRKATKYFMLNVSDMRPVTMSMEYIFRFLWNPEYYPHDPVCAQRKVFVDWALLQFTDDLVLAEKIADVLDGYFDVSYISSDTARKGEQHLSQTIRDVLSGEEQDSLDALAFVTEPLQQWRALIPVVLDLLPRVQKNRRVFYFSSVVAQYLIHFHGCVALQHVANFALADSYSEKLDFLDEALVSIDNLLAAERRAEEPHSKWRGFYSGDILDDFFEVRCLIELAKAQLESRQMICNPWQGGTGRWSPWFSFDDTTVNFPFLDRSEEWNMDNIVRVLCSPSSSSTCDNSPVGGTFHSGPAYVSMTVSNGARIHYTTSLVDPDENSPVYSGVPIEITESTVIRAWAGGFVTRSSFLKVTGPAEIA